MKKHDFIYTGLWGYKNIIYENVTNCKRLEDLMRIFSNYPLIVKIPYDRHNFLPAIIYVTCEFEPKEFCSHYRKYVEKDGYSDLLLKIDRIAECKQDPRPFTSLLSSTHNCFVKI
jgi:putative component of membrane protein insertase Oxa1/YidC/SpoIIIJ protein YidD